MDRINDPPTLQDFYQDMNNHSSAEYRMRANHVIELERDPSRDRARLQVWTAQQRDGKYIPGRTNATYHWYSEADNWDEEYDEETLDLLATSQMHFDDFVDVHSGGTVEPRTDIPQR